MQGLEDCGVDLEADAMEGSHQVRQETRQVVVAVVEGEPPDSGVCPALIKVGEPVAEQSGLAEPGRCGHQGEPVARIESGVELLGKSRARDELRAPSRREQLGSKHRSRHPRIIKAPQTSAVRKSPTAGTRRARTVAGVGTALSVGGAIRYGCNRFMPTRGRASAPSSSLRSSRACSVMASSVPACCPSDPMTGCLQ